jgi:hypothetical protein
MEEYDKVRRIILKCMFQKITCVDVWLDVAQDSVQ